MEAVSWKDVRATIHVREIDVQRQDKSWQVHDSAPTLVDSDVASQKAFFDTGRFELTTEKQLGPPLLEVDWHVNVCQIVAGTRAEELKQMAAIMKRANAGVRKHGGRASILNKVVAAKECGGSLDSFVPKSHLDREFGWQTWLAHCANQKHICVDCAAAL